MTTQYFQYPQLLADGIDRAKGGDHETALDLLETFCEFAKLQASSGAPIPQALIDYIAVAFAAHLDDDKPIGTALHLGKPPHRQVNAVTWEKMRAAALYQLERRANVGILESRERAAERMGVGIDTVRRAVEALDLSYLGDKELRVLAEPAAPGEED